MLHQLNESLHEDQELSLENIAKHYRSMIGSPEVYHNAVFEDEGVVLGFVSIIFYHSVYHRIGTALISELVVSKDHRNRKIGKALLDHAIELSKARDMDEIEIGVMKDNVKAIEFYKSNGIRDEFLLLGKEFR